MFPIMDEETIGDILRQQNGHMESAVEVKSQLNSICRLDASSTSICYHPNKICYGIELDTGAAFLLWGSDSGIPSSRSRTNRCTCSRKVTNAASTTRGWSVSSPISRLPYSWPIYFWQIGGADQISNIFHDQQVYFTLTESNGWWRSSGETIARCSISSGHLLFCFYGYAHNR